MTGLSKITDKILDEARAEASARLAEADAECERINEEYAQKAKKIEEDANNNAKNEAAEMIFRAKAAEKNLKRNIISNMQGEMIDRTFSVARDELCGLADAERLELLTKLLCAALTSEWEAEQSRADIYGQEEDEQPRIYEILLNAKDRKSLGDGLVNNFRRKIVGRDYGDIPSRVVLSSETVDIEGGLIIRVGAIEINCSVETIIEHLRPQLEAQVSKILFP